MTDETPDPTDEPLDDVDDALESAGFAESDEPDADSADEPDDSSFVDTLSNMTGTGKDLDSYESDPVASVFADEAGNVPRGAKHIARGVDGMSPFAAAHPLVDIAVGVVLLKAEGRIDSGSGDGTTDPPAKPDDGDDSDSRGDMLS